MNAEGINAVKAKVTAVVDSPIPTSVTELKAYLGLLNYYNRFLPNLSTLLAPLHHLLKKDVIWRYSRERFTVGL